MKKLIAAVALFGSVCAFGAIDDTTVVVGSKGPDKYADGTQALVGECGGFGLEGHIIRAVGHRIDVQGIRRTWCS